MEITSTNNVKVEMGAGMPMHYKLANVLSIVVSGVIAVAVTAVLADGMSVIKLKDAQDLPIITNRSYDSSKYGTGMGIHHRADELLGPTYGIGLHHDQSGRGWTRIGGKHTLSYLEWNLGGPVGTEQHERGIAVIAGALNSVAATDDIKHPVPFLECNALQAAGLSAMSLGFIADAVAIVMIIFHTAAVAGLLDAKMVQPVAGLVWTVLVIGFLVVNLLAVGIFTATWTCHNTIIPSIRISDHFDFNYGFPFAIAGYISALLVLAVTAGFNTPDKPKGPGISAGILVLGIVVYAIGTVSVAAGNSSFDSKAPIDDTINICAGQKPKGLNPGDHYFDNMACMKDGVIQTLEQAGGNVTAGFVGGLMAGDRVPITVPYSQTDLCPVNVHWHLGAEHYSAGQFDEYGTGPVEDGGNSSLPDGYCHDGDSGSRRRLREGERRGLAGSCTRLGFRCRAHDFSDPKFTTPFNWQHCVDMKVGETYEIHWPHSAAGACGTKWQYQEPFYDGVFCKDGIIKVAPLNTYEKIGVQSQTFVVVNDEAYYEANLMAGMLTGASPVTGQPARAADMAMYTGSTTGTSRDNAICSRYAPITWQVDRTCHMVSASSFDKLCQDMKANLANGGDDMSGDYYPHGARTLVAPHLTANNQQS